MTRSTTASLREHARLAQHVVDQGGLAVVDVGHDGHVPDVLSRNHEGLAEHCRGAACS
jgi:hypothetical protein